MFRIKIVLLSILISGSILIVFGLYFLNVIHDVSLGRIDREIRTLGEGPLRVWLPRRHWEELDKSLRFIYGTERWKDIIVQVKDAGNEVLYRSPHWPGGISETSSPNMIERWRPCRRFLITSRRMGNLSIRRSEGPLTVPMRPTQPDGVPRAKRKNLRSHPASVTPRSTGGQPVCRDYTRTGRRFPPFHPRRPG